MLLALPVSALAMPAPYAGETPWTGAYIGAHAGINQSSASGLNTENSLAAGVSGGYRLALANPTASPIIIGGDVFADLNAQATHNANVSYGSNVVGVDLMAGYPLGDNQALLPYVKVGLGNLQATGDLGGNDIGGRLGIGLKYHLRPRLSIGAQWMSQDANNINNDNFTVGVDYTLPMG
ncbi:hypothetical protein BI364_06750 [Acidihalobacter yilgarnensis]|uniref:Outer membrane protein beta-barrel domain-containing protein n=1 Tax=Acidihalobacter yilgarnensis TaxID=2819280 RepID=A0A1D8IMJ7_9GAMM|nr:porin family protein [Acidihalobacter yilgarnensis]AOU97697.1 hypothetical protein BI364_06750 [Acidihalobacter yilgarnensis]